MREIFTKEGTFAILFAVFALCSSSYLHASGVSNIVFEGGYRPVAEVVDLPQTQTVEDGSAVAITNLGIQPSGYVMIGWSSMPINMLVTTSTIESVVKKMGTFYEIGSSITVASETTTTLYAIWAVDKNNNGAPDYYDVATINTRSFGTRSEVLEQDDEVSLRRGGLPNWDYYNDLQMSDDRVYFTDCKYNYRDMTGDGQTELYIGIKGTNSFDYASYVEVRNPLYLIFEYDGALTKSGLIGGRSQSLMDTIKLEPGTEIKSVLNDYPFSFSEVAEGGDATIKIHLVRDDGTFENYADTSDVTLFTESYTLKSWGSSWASEKPFGNSNDGWYSDVLTFDLKVYNKPVFESKIISQRIDFQGYINLKHESGTPLKYMMRSINGLGWQPADAPLKNYEKEAVYDGVSICLRELDPTLGQYAWFLHDYLLNPNAFNANDSWAYDFWASEHARQYGIFADENIHKYDSIRAIGLAWQSSIGGFMGDMMYDAFISSYVPTGDELLDGVMRYLLLTMLFTPLLDHPDEEIDLVAAENLVQARADAAMPAIGQALFDEYVKKAPDACREVICMEFIEIPNPEVRRYVEINTLPGVTSDYTAGMRHYVKAQNDFTFTLTFSAGEPFKVIANGYYTNASVELEGTRVGARAFSYTLKHVVEPWTIDVMPELASGSVGNDAVTGDRVWAYANTLYINSQKATRANIYTLSGALLKQIDVPAGMREVQLERGVYIVEMNGIRYKVVAK